MTTPYIFVIPGHGAGDSGACGNGYKEAEQVRKLATRIKEIGGSRVKLANFSRNYYADKGISTLTLSPKKWQLVELHMDSASASSAKGGHVIILDGLSPDSYDKALAANISSFFPGRSNSIVKRSDLANPKRAEAKNYAYRLVENGFISNKGDAEKFATDLDGLARQYLDAFGIQKLDYRKTYKTRYLYPSRKVVKADRIVRIPKGTALKVNKHVGNWYQTSYKGETGWVYALYKDKEVVK